MDALDPKAWEAAKAAASAENSDYFTFDAKLKAAIAAYLTASRPEQGEAVAWWVHDFHIARQPVKAQGKFPEPTEYLYPANRERGAKSAASILGAECSPLYAAPLDRTDAEKYEPCIVHFEDANRTEFLLRDEAMIYGDEVAVQAVYSMAARELAGFAWSGKSPQAVADRIAALEQELAEVRADRDKWYCHCENAENEAERFKEWSERHAHRRVRAEARQWMVTEERDAWHTRAEAAEARCEQLEAVLKDFNCPRPCNDRPDDFSVGQCIGADECGCSARAALSQAEAGVQPKEQAVDALTQAEHVALGIKEGPLPASPQPKEPRHDD